MKRPMARLLAYGFCVVLCVLVGSVAHFSLAYANSAPVLSPIGNQSVQRGSELSVQINASDPDGDPITITPAGLPSYAFFEDMGGGLAYLTVMPPATEPPSLFQVTMTASDGQLSTSETFTLKVYPAGNPNAPSMGSVADQTVAEGQTSSVTVSATDADQNVVTLSSSLPTFASLTQTQSGPGAASGRVDLAPGYCAAGSYTASVTASDGAWTDTKSFAIYVTDVNRAPVWNVPGGGYVLAVNEGSSATLNVSASDPDQACGSAAPSLVLASAPASLTVTLTDRGNGSGQLQVAGGYDAAGTYQVTLTARDATNSSLTADVLVQVTVVNVNRPPVASVGGPYSGVMGTPVSMSGSGSSDPDGDALSYSWAFGDGYTGTGVTTSHAYATGGTFNVCLTVTDNGTPNLSNTQCTTATLQRVNHAPVASAGGPYTGVVGVAVNMTSAGSSDPDGDLFTCAWTFGDGGTGTGPTPSHVYMAPGTDTVTVVVTDNGTPSMSATSATTATITDIRPASVGAVVTCVKSFVQLNAEGRYHGFRIAPQNGSFGALDVNLASVVMKYGTLQASADYACLRKDSDRDHDRGRDRDHSGGMTVMAFFSSATLRPLFDTSPVGRSMVTVTVEATLVSGTKVVGDVTFMIKKEPPTTSQSVSVSPNPFNPQATMSLTIPVRGAARVRLYDSGGRLVRTLLDESDAAAGTLTLTPDGRAAGGAKLASGVYYYRVETSAGTPRGQFVIMK